MNAFSAGFMPGEYDYNDDVLILKQNELLEMSAVSVPANALALAKSKGLSVAEIEKEVGIAKEEVAVDKDIKTEEKGDVADQVEDEQVMEKKWELMKPVSKIYWAFIDVWYNEETSLEDFNKLLTETGELFIKHANGEEIKSLIQGLTKEVSEDRVKELIALVSKNADTKEETTEEDTTTDKKEVEEEQETEEVEETEETVKEEDLIKEDTETETETPTVVVDLEKALETIADAELTDEQKAILKDKVEEKTEETEETDDETKEETPEAPVVAKKHKLSMNRRLNKIARDALKAKKKLS
jgi:hypothetical protein